MKQETYGFLLLKEAGVYDPMRDIKLFIEGRDFDIHQRIKLDQGSTQVISNIYI